MNFLWNQPYSCMGAEDGKFLPIDNASLSSFGYPLSGRGKYVVLTKELDAPGSAGSAPVSAVIVEPVTINGGIISADNVEIDNLFFTIPVSAYVTKTYQPNISLYESQTIAAHSSAVITFSPLIYFLEVYNRDVNNTVYLSFNIGSTFAQVTANGMPLDAEAYYSVERCVTSAVIANDNDTSTEVRVIGHYYS